MRRAQEALAFAVVDEDRYQNLDLAILMLGLAKIKLKGT